MIKASVVVPTYNRWNSLRRCLESLLSQRFEQGEYEILVVSDGSTDGTEQGMAAFTSDPRVRFLQQSNQGVAAAMNSGIRVARGEIVLIIDDDCICEPDLVAAHVQAHEDDEHLVVLGPVLVHSESPRTAVTELVRECGERDFIRSTTEGLNRADMILCSNSSIRLSLLQNHSFDQRYRRSADIELGIRLHRAGAQLRYAPDAVAYQMYSKSADAFVADAASLSINEVRFGQQYPEYRAISSIAKWNSDRAWKRIARSVAARSPFSPEPVLKLLFSIVHPLRRHPLFLRIAKRVLRLRVGVASCRAAVSAASWGYLRALFLLRIPILLYHHVTSDSDSSPTEISMLASTFERQMQWLSQSGYVGIGISDFIAWWENNSRLPSKPVLITFDDAYDDTAQHAFPILERLRFSALCMVVTGEIGKLNRWDFDLGWRPLRLMDHEGLLRWKHRGIEYGAHSCTHRDLRTLNDDDLQSEFAGSRSVLEGITHVPIRSFAYPYGLLDRRVRDQAARFFDFAFTTGPHPSGLATDPLLLGRIEPLPSDTRFDFVSRVRWGWSPKLRMKAKFAKLMLSIMSSLRSTKTSRDVHTQRDAES
jgi:GT2 family glycosyltransferase/peptidoglycan/xylan/chitin deacetylase (PgdA/CDA1 family)